MTDADKNAPWRNLGDQMEIAGHHLIETVSGLISQGNVRTLRIKTGTGQVFLEIPLTTGAVAGGVVVLTAPWLAAIGAIAGVAGKVQLEIVRQDSTAPVETGTPPAAKPTGDD